MIGITRFVLYFTAFASLVFGIAKGVEYIYMDKLILSVNFIPVFIFLYVLTIIVYFLGVWGMRIGPENSIFSILGGVVIKMVLSLSFVFYLFLKFPENQKVLVVNFFLLYFLFTVFEVTVMLCNLRDQNKK